MIWAQELVHSLRVPHGGDLHPHYFTLFPPLVFGETRQLLWGNGVEMGCQPRPHAPSEGQRESSPLQPAGALLRYRAGPAEGAGGRANLPAAFPGGSALACTAGFAEGGRRKQKTAGGAAVTRGAHFGSETLNFQDES